MKIEEINNRITELETSIGLLEVIKAEYNLSERSEDFIKALDDGIRYTKMRLDRYREADWIMWDEKGE